MTLGWLHIHYEVDSGQQEMDPIGLGHERIYGLQSTVGQFQVIGKHDNGYFGPDLLDLIGDGCTVQEAEVVFEDDGIHGTRHEKPQAVGTVGSGCQLVSVFLQQNQLSWIVVYAQQGVVGTDAGMYIKEGSCGSDQKCSPVNRKAEPPNAQSAVQPVNLQPLLNDLVNFDQPASRLSLNTDIEANCTGRKQLAGTV
ncbi:MAG: hypothetical protein ABSG70_18200 [Terriglobales bacterium]|jgi:hypothetical protein